MSGQREDNISASIAGMKEALGIEGGTFSGGQIHAFREGWAKDIWSGGMKAHFWKRHPLSLAVVWAACGVMSATKNMYGEGNCQRCKRCEKRVSREGDSGK